MKLLNVIAYLFVSISIFLLFVLFFGIFDLIFNYLDENNKILLKENIGQILTGSITLATFIIIYLDFNIKSKQYEKIQEEVNSKLDINTKILENLKFEEQVRIFSQAEMVIAPHGAGITNIVFSNRNTDLIELVPGYKTKNYLMYSEIAAFKKINYYLIVDNSIKKNYSKKTFNANIFEIEKILKKLINH
jgi:hypothetical protein